MLIFHVLLILYVLGISRSFFKASVLSPWYPALVMIKVAYAFLYAFIYSYCYIERNDSLCYHHDGVLFNKYFWSAPMQYLKILLYNEFAPTQHPAEFCMWGLERSFFMSKMISVFYILGAQNYWLVTIYSALVNFFAVYYFCNGLARKYPSYKYAIIMGFFLFPSIQIWTSGLLKESYAVAGMFLCLGMYVGERRMALKFLLCLPVVFIIYKIKSYYLLFVPFMILHYLACRYNKFILGMGVICVMALVIFLFHNRVEKGVQVLLYSHDVSYYLFTKPHSNQHTGDVTVDAFSIGKNSFNIIFSACFAPRHLPAENMLRFVESCSNLLVLACAIITLTYMVMYKKRVSLEVWMLLGFIIISAFVVGISVPNIGAMIRIRVFYYPFVVFLSIIGPAIWFQKVIESHAPHE